MDIDDLAAALRACTAALYPLHAGVALLMSNPCAASSKETPGWPTASGLS